MYKHNTYLFTIIFVLVSFFSQTATSKFIGLFVENITNNDNGLSEYALYALFDDPTDNLLGVIDVDIVTNTGFFHNSIGGIGQSALPFTTEQTNMSDNPDADSFVTIGLMTGDDNATFLSISFDEDSFINGKNIVGAWFNANPPNGQGLPGPNGEVLIAVFTPLKDKDGLEGIVSGVLTVGYSVGGPDPKFATDTFMTPTPGTLGLFVVAVFIGKRRRRV